MAFFIISEHSASNSPATRLAARIAGEILWAKLEDSDPRQVELPLEETPKITAE